MATMRDTVRCPACSSEELWHIAEVLERDMGLVRMPVFLDGAAKPVGSFELLVCARCGLAEWWAHGVDGPAENDRPRARLVEQAPPCPDCAATEAWDIKMLDLATGLGAVTMTAATVLGQPAPPLWTWVCRPCGLTRWRIVNDEPFVPDAPTGTFACRSCGAEKAIGVRCADATVEIRQRGALLGSFGRPAYATRFVAGGQGLLGQHYWGRFELRVCSDCGHVDWVGRALEQLKESAKFGVRKLRGRPSGPAGPYR